MHFFQFRIIKLLIKYFTENNIRWHNYKMDDDNNNDIGDSPYVTGKSNDEGGMFGGGGIFGGGISQAWTTNHNLPSWMNLNVWLSIGVYIFCFIAIVIAFTHNDKNIAWFAGVFGFGLLILNFFSEFRRGKGDPGLLKARLDAEWSAEQALNSASQ